jgi:hypothetical protein
MKQVLARPWPGPDERIPGIVIYPFVHTFAAIIPTEKYFESHPEYFGLVKGKRQGGMIGGQLCLTNPEALEYLDLMDRLKDTNGKHYPTNGWDPPEVATPEFVSTGLVILNRGLSKASDQVHRGRVENLLLPLWFIQLGWRDRFGLSKEQGRELIARFKNVVQAFGIKNDSEGLIGNMSRFLADMEAHHGK